MQVLETQLEAEWFDEMVEMRRTLHRFPELSGNEVQTAERICEHLDRLEIPYTSGVAGHGILAEIPGAKSDGPLIALRADMDALPILEETGLPFSSKVDGLMHACGHDGHVSMLLGAATLLARHDPPPTPIRLVFQPAEETGRGAKDMIEAGALEDVSMIFGGHLDRHYPLGTIMVTEGAVNASSDKFHIEISGRGGHAARPHETTDAVVVGALLVMAIQTIVSREVNPAHPSVVTVGRFDAGTAANVIAGRAVLEGSIRAQDPDVREFLHQSIERIAASVGNLHGANIEARIIRGTPPVINPSDTVRVARIAAGTVVGDGNVRQMEVVNMGGEDFSYYMERCRGCYVRFGAIAPGKEGYPAHSSRFDFDEGALGIGAKYYYRLAHEAGRYA